MRAPVGASAHTPHGGSKSAFFTARHIQSTIPRAALSGAAIVLSHVRKISYEVDSFSKEIR